MVAEKLLLIDEGHAYETAYTAMLHAARAFMFSKGYRPTAHFQHKTVVDFAFHYLDEKYKTLVDHFDRMRKARNNLIYEPWKTNITLTDAENALKTARDFIMIIKTTIRKQNPQEHFKFL